MFTWSVEASCETTASKEKIWQLWADVPNWPRWDDGLEWCQLDGPFAVGSKGQLKPTGSPKVSFVITAVEPFRSYSDVSFLPFTKLYFNHTIEQLPNGKYGIKHHAQCKGLLAPILWFTLRRSLQEGMPQSVSTLAKIAQRR